MTTETITREELTALFHRLGAKQPELWAESQLTEGIPQLARYLFLMCAWKRVIDPQGASWIEDWKLVSKGAPGASTAAALERLQSAGANMEDISVVVRAMQWKLLQGLCDLLDDPSDEILRELGVDWQLFLLDDKRVPVVAIPGLHESVLQVDPSGDEMGAAAGADDGE